MSTLRQSWSANRTPGAAGIIILLLCGCGALIDATTFFAAWLVGWWTCAAMVLGAQANLWLHGLTGGSWINTIHSPLQRTARTIPVLSLLLLPLLASIPFLYPWAHPGWADDLKHPAFKTAWLSPGFFIARLLVYLVLWNALIWFSSRPGTACRTASRTASRKGYSAFGLLLFGYTISLAAADLVMSLMPHWYSSGFGLLAITAQMQAAFALAVFVGAPSATPHQRRDLGNLLLMYVLLWAYLAFVQFQIIWAENLPQEIAWYVPRLLTPWRWLGIALIVGGFFAPLMLLLFRSFKENAACLRFLAGFLCVMSLLDSAWLILPSVDRLSPHVIWMCPFALIGMGLVLWAGGGDARTLRS